MPPIKELEIERTYDAPVNNVWKAWTEPEQIKVWWGPDNVSIPECEVDLRVGGRIYIVMEAGEAMGPYKGTRWPMDGTFTEVKENSRLAYVVKAWTEGQEDTTEIDQVTDLTLHEDNGKTIIKLKATINKTGPNAKMAVEGMRMGFNQQLEKLSDFLK
jgi:uncharacterized protein YndB with AHSA1/START domain